MECGLYYKMKYTPNNIISLQPNEIFVFGANKRGIHSAGAARLALQWGAVMGQTGLMGQTYGLCTKDENIRTLSLSEIQKEVNIFFEVAKNNPDKTFLVTKIDCGLAGYSEVEIAPLFMEIYWDVKDGIIKNILLPKEFWEYLDSCHP